MRTVGDISFERERLPLGVFEPNRGQVDGLPANPRKWTKAEVERLAQSIRETPELLELRPLIALRLEAARSLGLREVTADVIVPGAPTEKLREIVIKDNGSFGEWDADLLKKDWGDVDLQAWGVAGLDAEDASAPEDGDEEEKEKKKAAVSQLLVCGVSVIGENGDCVLVREIPEAVADRLSAMGTEDLEKFGDAVLKCIAEYDV